MTTHTQFQQLIEHARTASTQEHADEFLDLVSTIGQEWHDNSVDALIERSNLLTQTTDLRDQLICARRDNDMLEDLIRTQREQIEFLTDQLDDFEGSASTRPGSEVAWFEKREFDDVSFDSLFASELMESVDSLLTTQEAVVAALARLGALVEPEPF